MDSKKRKFYGGMIESGLEIALRVEGTNQMLEGNSVIADKAAALANRLAVRGVLRQSGFILGDLFAATQDSEIIEGKIVDTEQGPGQLTDRI